MTLVVADRNGNLSGLQALKEVAFTAGPVVDELGEKEERCQLTPALFQSNTFDYLVLLDHLAQLDDEAVSFVEAVPGHGNLSGSDYPTTFDMQQALDICIVGHNVLEA